MNTRSPKTIYRSLLVLSLFTFLSFNAMAQTKTEIVHGSYFLAFGRFANSGELKYWLQQSGDRNIKQMVANHRGYIKSNQYEREQVVRRSYMDAFGWQPSADELRYWSGQERTYSELMSNHINNWLNVYRDKKEHVIRQSYYKVFGRNANASELQYWMSQPTYSFVQLVATHTTWKQKNQASSSVTAVKANIQSNGISTFGFSQQGINEVIAAGGGNVVAPGGGNVVAAGGGNVIAPGGGN